MNKLRTLFLIARRDFKERVTSKAFLLSTGLTLVLVVGFVLVPTMLDPGKAPNWSVGVVGSFPDTFQASLEAAAPTQGTTVDIVPFQDKESATAALRGGEIDIAVDAGGEVIADSSTDTTLTSLVAATAGSLRVLDTARELGLSDQDIAKLLGSASFKVIELEPKDPGNDANRNAALLGTIFLFISIVTYGQWILIGVIEEKTNRVVEVVLGAVRPHQLLAGKVMGIGLLGLIQLILIALIAVSTILASGAVDIPDAAIGVALNVVLWFILGFAFYATAYAAAGSLVSRQEEAQNAAFPLTLLLMAAYFVATFSFTGDNPVLRIFSLLPPFAPMTMPIRMAGGDALAWEIAVSLSLMIITTYLLIRLAGRIYAGGILRTGGKVKLKDAWRSAEV